MLASVNAGRGGSAKSAAGSRHRPPTSNCLPANASTGMLVLRCFDKYTPRLMEAAPDRAAAIPQAS